MVLPQTYGAALLLIVVSMLCWGSWANTFKLAGKWRFELFYYDYSLGVLIAATIYALTLGNFGADGFGFVDDLAHAGKRQIFFGAVGGVVFNLANMLLVAAISLAGLSVAFPVGIGLALVIGVIWNYILKPQGNPALVFRRGYCGRRDYRRRLRLPRARSREGGASGKAKWRAGPA